MRALQSVPESDLVLIERVRRGDKQAFYALYKRYALYIAGAAYRILGNDTEIDDVVQDTFVSAARKIDQLKDPSQVRLWLAAISVRNANRRLPKRRAMKLFGLSNALDLRQQNANWDEVRERRVYNLIKNELCRPNRYHVRLVVGGIGVATALLVLALIVTSGPVEQSEKSEDSNTSVPAAVAVEEGASQESWQKKENNFSQLAFADAGRVTMTVGARVVVLTQSDTLLELEQTNGSARYQINYKAGREVFVYLLGVKVRVVGTVFKVAVEDKLITVEVESGRVRIDDGRRIVELSDGEKLAVTSQPRKEHKLSSNQPLK